MVDSALGEVNLAADLITNQCLAITLSVQRVGGVAPGFRDALQPVPSFETQK